MKLSDFLKADILLRENTDEKIEMDVKALLKKEEANGNDKDTQCFMGAWWMCEEG